MAVVGPAGAGAECNGFLVETASTGAKQLSQPLAAGVIWWYATFVAELGLAILVIGGLLVVDRERLQWATAKVRDLIDWLSS